MLANGEYVDGSWLLSIYIHDLNIQRDIRVHGEWSINELITQLIDGLICPQRKLLQSNEISLHSNHIKMNWEDYGLWWPIKSKWLLKTKLSLNQYGLQADAKLHFLSIYGQLNIQLPDLQIRKFIDINFAEPVYRVTLSICHYLNIRHSEELSLGYPIQQNDLKHSRFIPNSINKHDQTLLNTKKYSTFQRSATINTTHSQYKTLHKESLFQMNNEMNINQSQQQDDEGSMKSSILSKHSIQLYGPPIIRDKRHHYYSIRHNSRNSNHQTTLSSIPFNLRIVDDPSLIYSPIIHIDEAIQNHLIVRPNNYIQRIRLNTIWLDSSKSLLEQGITMLGYNPSSSISSSSMNRPNSSGQVQNDEYTKLSNSNKDNNTIPTLILRYKYGIYYDLNIKYDLIRINQLYEQAKWSILSEIYDVTDEEACLFAALQCQVELATEQETLMNDENLLNNDNDNEEHKGINDTIDTNDKQQLVNCSLDKSIIDNCNKNMKKMKSTLMKHNRDISPLGGYLHTTGYYSMKSSTTTTPSRPLSTIELDHEIDIMLDELSIDCLQNKDSNRLSNDIQHSKLKEHSIRPLSLLNTSNHNEDDIDSLMNHEQYDNDNQYNLPELNTYVKICKPRKFGLKVFHRYYISIKGIELYVYKNKDDYLSNSDTVEVIYLPGCEIQSDLCITNEKFNIRLFVPITRTNLPLSSAFASYQSNKIQTNDEDPTISSKLKRRASLLSLTSLSHLSNALGISSSSSSSSSSSHHHTQNGLINISGIGALTGSSATMTGLINELWLRFFNLNDYIDWLTILRMTTAIQSTIMLHSYTDISNTSSKKLSKKQQIILSSLLNRSTFNIEHKAITNLINLLSPNCLNLKQTNNEMINLTRLYNHLEKRFIDLLPLRLGYLKVSQRTWDYRRDHYYNQYDSLLKRSNTLTNQDKPPIHSQTIQTRTNFIQRIASIYSQINNLTSLQCKLKYINVWEQLHLHGIAFFTGRIEVIVPLNTLIHNENDALYNDSNSQINWLSNINQSIIHNNYVTISISRKIESIGIGSKRIYRCDLTNGDIIASWKMSSIQSWHINWELNELILNLMNQTKIQSNIKNTTHNINNSSNSSNSKMDYQSIGKFNEFTGRVIIRPIDVSVRMIAEFLGGYTFLNLRSPEKNQYLAEDIFYKLTTGISQPSI